MSSPSPSSPPGKPQWQDRHLWEIQPVRDLLLLALLLGLVYLGYVARVVTVPILLAMALAYLFEPLVSWVTRRRLLSRDAAASAIIAISAIVVVVPLTLAATFGVVQGLRLTQTTASNIDLLIKSVGNPQDERLRAQITGEGWGRLRDFLVEEQAKARARQIASDGAAPVTGEPSAERSAQGVAEPQPNVETTGGLLQHVLVLVRDNSRVIGQQLLATSAGAFSLAAGLLGSLAYVILTGSLTAFFFFFFCTGWGSVLAFWEGLIPERRKGLVIDMLHQMDRVIAGFVRGRITICATLGVVATVGYWLIGTPAPLVFGPLVGALFILPYVHAIVVPIVMIAMAIEPSSVEWQATWWWMVAGPLIVYGICQVLDDYVLTPVIQGNNTGMDTPTIVFASLAGGAIAGIYGLLIAIPFAACVKILLRMVFWPRFKAWAQGRARDFLPIAEKPAGTP